MSREMLVASVNAGFRVDMTHVNILSISSVDRVQLTLYNKVNNYYCYNRQLDINVIFYWSQLAPNGIVCFVAVFVF